MEAAIAHSYLFVPGNRPERFDKACAAGAGAVIIDLEDAVPPSERSRARTAVEAWANPAHPVVLRINGVNTDWFRDDVTCARIPGIQAVMLPKTESVQHLRRVEELLGQTIPILALIETAQGFANALEIARDRAVHRLVFGSLDFQLDVGIPGEQEELLYFRSQLVLISRLAGLQAPVDGISTAIDNPEVLRADAVRARRLGFGGKLCIHPKQIPIVNECFRPSEAEVGWARKVVAAAEASRGAAVALEGQMIDRPVIAKAQRILDELERGAGKPAAG
ncbi:MAG TPA: CoA ester lyase [Bryobacteraceae bacterium]|nr:CoA ester lyase [Bryobacteraceae bacterium]